MFKKNGKRLDTSSLVALSASAIAAIVGLLLALVVLLVCDAENAWAGFATLITGGIRDGGIRAVGDILYLAMPLMMCGAGIAVAFVATIYGLFAANLVMIPLGTRIKFIYQNVFLYKNMILEGVLSIQAGESPVLIERKLRSFILEDSNKDAQQ